MPGEACRTPAPGEDQEEECVVVVTGLRKAQLNLVGILKRPGVCVCKREGPVRHGRRRRGQDSMDFCVRAKSFSPTLGDLMDRSLPGSSVHGILQARILEWVAMPSSMGSS